MSYSLKIDGDFSSVKKGIQELSKEFKGLSKSQKTSLFSKEDAALLSRQTLDVTKAMGRELERINKNAERYKTLIKSSTLSEQAKVKAAKKYNALLKNRVTLQKSMKEMEDFTGTSQGPGRAARIKSGLGRGMGGLGRGMSRIPGVGAMRGLGGLGLMGGLGMMGGAALGFGAYKGMQGYQQFKGGSQQRLMMQARGIKNTSGLNQGLSDLGYTPEEIRAQQVKGAAAFGKGGGSQGGVLQRAQFERSTGLEKGAMMEAGQGLRGAMGEKSAQEAMFKLQAGILAGEITSNIGPFLETSAQMLTSMNENGLPADGEMMALFTSMVKSGTGEQKAMRQIMSVNQAISGSSGDPNALFQSLFSGAGIGGGTMGGAQLGVKQGLFGGDTTKMKTMGMTPDQIKSFSNLGLTQEKGGFGKRAGAIVDFADKSFGTSDEETIRKENVLSQLLGTQAPGEALGFVEKLRGAKGDPEKLAKIEKQLKEASKTPEQKMQESVKKGIDALQGIDSEIEKHTGKQAKTMEEIGISLKDTGIFMDKALTSIDGGVSAIAKYLTGDYESPLERKRKLEQERQTSLSSGLSSRGLSQGALQGMSEGAVRSEKAKAGGALVSARSANQAWEPKVNPKTGMTTNAQEKSELMKAEERAADAYTAIGIHLEKIVKASEKTANNTKKLKSGKSVPGSVKGVN